MATFKLLGGAACLDFANTVDWRRGEPQEQLNSASDLIDWAEQAGTLTSLEAQELRTEARQNPEKAEAMLRRATALREAVYRIFKAHADGAAPGEADLESLNQELAAALGHMALTQDGRGFSLRLRGAPQQKLLGAVAQSASQLLTGPSLGRVRECADPRCGWLFLDTSRNGTRRWCSMRDCGNRNKARRHHRRRTG